MNEKYTQNLQNDTEQTPLSKAMETARNLIGKIEENATVFGPAERDLIVAYACQIKDEDRISNLAYEMAEAKYELTNGSIDFAVADRVYAQIEEVNPGYTQAWRNGDEPFEPEPIGSLRYEPSGEIIPYYDNDELMNNFCETLMTNGPASVTFEGITDDALEKRLIEWYNEVFPEANEQDKIASVNSDLPQGNTMAGNEISILPQKDVNYDSIANKLPQGSMKADLAAQLTQMEFKLTQLNVELEAMRLRKDNPLRAAMEQFKEAVKKILQRITALKNRVLAGTIDGLKIKSVLGAIRADQMNTVHNLDQSIKNIENAGRAYHETGLSIRNFGRALMGKERIDTAKENGKLTAALTAPARSQRNKAMSIANAMAKAIQSLEAFTQTHKKKSILNPMREKAAQIAAAPSSPSPERRKAAAAL